MATVRRKHWSLIEILLLSLKIIQLSKLCGNDVVERSNTNTNSSATKHNSIVVHQTCVNLDVCWLNKCFTKYRWSSPERVLLCNNLSPQISQGIWFFSKHFCLAQKLWKCSKQMPDITNYYSHAIFDKTHTHYWYKTVHLLCDIHCIHWNHYILFCKSVCLSGWSNIFQYSSS